MKKILMILALMPALIHATVRGYWPGNIGDSQITDHSGFGNNLSQVGSMPNPSVPVAPEGNAWTYQGPGGEFVYLSAPSGAYNSGNTAQISIYFYLQTTSTAISAIMSVDDGLDLVNHIGFQTTAGGKLTVSYKTALTQAVSSTAVTVNDGTSHLVRFTSGTITGTQLYVDGVLQVNDSNPSILGVFGQIIFGQETLNGTYTTNNTYVDAMQIGDQANDAFLGPSNPTTPTVTPTQTTTASPSSTPSWTPTNTPTITLTPTPTASFTITKTKTPTSVVSPTSTLTWSPTLTLTPSPTITKTNTPTATQTPTPTPSTTATPSPSPTPTTTPLTSSPVYVTDAYGTPLYQIEKFSDLFTNSSSGISHYTDAVYSHYFSAEVTEQGGSNATYTVAIEGSLDGVSWTTLLTLNNTNPGPGKIMFPQKGVPVAVFWVRASVTSLTLNSATSITVLTVASR